MNKMKWTIIWSALMWTLMFWSSWMNYKINDLDISCLQNNIKASINKIVIDSNLWKLLKIYNPANPDGIETDDWYIYIVNSERSLDDSNT